MKIFSLEGISKGRLKTAGGIEITSGSFSFILTAPSPQNPTTAGNCTPYPPTSSTAHP